MRYGISSEEGFLQGSDLLGEGGSGGQLLCGQPGDGRVFLDLHLLLCAREGGEDMGEVGVDKSKGADEGREVAGEDADATSVFADDCFSGKRSAVWGWGWQLVLLEHCYCY